MLIRVVLFSNNKVVVYGNYSNFSCPDGMGCNFAKKVCTFDKKENIAIFSNCGKTNIA